MTFLAAWRVGDRVVLCADSAVTTSGCRQLQAAESSFGESHLEAEEGASAATVEESALKLMRLAPSVLAGVVGEVEPAGQFLDSVRRRLLAAPGVGLREVLRYYTEAGRPDGAFGVVFGHVVDSQASLTFFSTAEGVVEFPAGFSEAVRCGSLRPELATLVSRAAMAARCDLPAEVAQVATQAFAQSLFVHDYLVPEGVGGALFTGYVDGVGAGWQPDVCYVLYPPGEFAAAPVVSPEGAHAPRMCEGLVFVRTLVREGCGIAVTSLATPASPAVRVFGSPSIGSVEEMEDVVRRSLPVPYRPIANGQYFVFMSKAYRRILVLVRDAATSEGQFAFSFEGEKVVLASSPRLVAWLEAPVAPGRAILGVVFEEAGGAREWGCEIPLG